MSHSWSLPISDDMCNKILSGAAVEFSELSHPEIASLVYLQKLSKLAAGTASSLELERKYAALLGIPHQDLLEVISANLDRNAIVSGSFKAAQCGIDFMSPEEVAGRSFLRPDGGWDFSFARRHEVPVMPYETVRADGSVMLLSDGQRRFLDAFRAMPDDNLRSQSFAGTGKTTIVYELVENIAIQGLKPITFLVDQGHKHRPIIKRIGKQKYEANRSRIKLLTYITLAVEVLAAGNNALERRFSRALSVNYAPRTIYERAQLASPGPMTVNAFVDLCWNMVRRYCWSTDLAISERHIPKGQRLRMSNAQTAAAVASAVQLWNATVSLEHSDLPMAGYHIIKLMALSGRPIPERYGIILIDELHDAPRLLIDVLQRSGLPVLMLGDRYQNLQGLDLPSVGTALSSDMTLSLRAGLKMADYVNPLIDMHPMKSTSGFSADNGKHTDFHQYPVEGFPEESTLIAVADEWGMLDWLIRGRRQGRVVKVFDPGMKMATFVADCESLFHAQGNNQHGSPHYTPTHGALSRYSSWQELSKAMSWNAAFCRVERWLDKGGRYGSLDRCEYLQPRPLEPTVVMVHDVKSMEMPAITISEDLYCLAREGSSQELSRTVARLYTAVTRGVERVHVPDSHMEWLAYLGGGQFRGGG